MFNHYYDQGKFKWGRQEVRKAMPCNANFIVRVHRSGCRCSKEEKIQTRAHHYQDKWPSTGSSVGQLALRPHLLAPDICAQQCLWQKTKLFHGLMCRLFGKQRSEEDVYWDAAMWSPEIHQHLMTFLLFFESLPHWEALRPIINNIISTKTSLQERRKLFCGPNAQDRP